MLVLSFGLVTAVPVAAAIYVGPAPLYETIQEAVDAAEPGETIIVEPGVYSEDVSVNKTLTLEGAQAGVCAVGGRSGDESELIGSIRVVSPAEDVTIDGFTITGTGAGPLAGVCMRIESPSATVINNIINAVEATGGYTYSGFVDLDGITDALVGCNSFSGVYEADRAPNVIRLGISGAGNVEVVNNEMHEVGGGGGIGIMCSNADAMIDIIGNMLDHTGDGIWVWNPESAFDTLLIAENLIHHNNGMHSLDTGTGKFKDIDTGVKLLGPISGTVIVTDNDFQDNRLHVDDSAAVLDIEQVLEDNTFDGAVIIDRPTKSLVHVICGNIQDAVNKAVSGDTVFALPGLYPIIHSIDILTDDLTILGANHDVNPVTDYESRGPESIVKLMACTYAFWIKDADFVTIAGFMIDATESGENHGYPDEGYTSLGVGIGPIGSGEPSADDATVSNNIIFGTSDYAIGAYAANTPSYLISRLQVLSNLIAECKYGFMGGVGLSQSLIQGNAIVDSYQTGEWGAIAFWGNISTTDILGNYIVDNSLAGIYLGGGNYNGVKVHCNEIRDNGGPGVWVSTGADVVGSWIGYNNIVGNTDYGLLRSGSVWVDATYNWWGDMSGPYQEGINPGGIGQPVSDDVWFDPWLTRGYQTVLEDGIAYIGRALVDVGTGWNLFSTPIALDPACDTWEEYILLGNGLAVDPEATTYYFDSQIQWYGQVLGTYQLKPCDAILVKMLEPDIAAICYSPGLSTPTKDVVAGWNLVSLSANDEMYVNEGLKSIVEVTGGLKGVVTVVSPQMNQPAWVYTGHDEPEEMLPTKGYFVFMLNDGTLAGFEFTPQSLDCLP